MKMDEVAKSIRSNQSRKGGPSAARPKVGRGIGRKRLRLSQTRPSNGRTDEDSGLGGETSTTDSLCDGGSPKSNESLSSYFIAVDGEARNLVLPSFGSNSSKSKSRSSSRCSKVESKPCKRLRLDMTEEANELPEQKCNTTPTAQQILSFKNVPDLRPVPSTNNLLNSVKIFSTNSLHSFLQSSKISKPQQVVQPVVQKVDKVEKQVKGESGLSSRSSDGKIFLELLSQPESQHRARYQTEGSRGAVKDRNGQGHPVVKLNGYSRRTVLKVFVASDGDIVGPHMFYQACKVTGKNSTPCSEAKEDGTVILLIDMAPENEMTVSCDCVGILKERNVDVEKRVKSVLSGGRKKSHKCRLVFRTSVTLRSGKMEELQVVSQPISCSQPPGLPEIGRMSLSKSSVEGGEDLYIIGKNFSKDTEVVFQKSLEDQAVWVQKMVPDKEYLNGTHLISKVPPYHDTAIRECVDVHLFVVSNGKKSDPQNFTYEPLEKKIEKHESGQLQPSPKGILPPALKLNRLYAESGDLELPKCTFSNKKPEHIEGLLATGKATAHSMIFKSTISSSSSPFVSTKTCAKMDSTNSNTFSTSFLSTSNVLTSPTAKTTSLFVPIMASTIAPALSILPDEKSMALASNPISVNIQQQQKVEKEFKPIMSENKIEDFKITGSSNHSVVENLCHMLKFVYALPVKLQSSLLELLSNELLTQIRGKGLSCDKSIVDSTTSTSVVVDPKLTVGDINVNENLQKSLKTDLNVISSADNLNLGFVNQIPNSSKQSYILPMAIIPPQNSNKRVNQLPLQATFATILSKQPATTHSLENRPKPFPHNIRTLSQYDSRQFNALSAQQKVQNLNTVPMERSSSNHRMNILNVNIKQQAERNNEVHNTQRALPNAIEKPQFLESNYAPSYLNEDLKEANSIESLFTTTPNFDFHPQQAVTSLAPLILTPTVGTISDRTLLTLNDSSQNVRQFAQHHMPAERPTESSFMTNSILHSRLSTGKAEHSNMLLHERSNMQSNCVSDSTLCDPLQGNNTVAESIQATYPHSLETTMSANLGSLSATYDLSSVMHSENCDPLLSQASNSPSLRIVTNSVHSSNYNVLNSAVSSDVTTTLPQLSESELLSYINPNCFDNV